MNTTTCSSMNSEHPYYLFIYEHPYLLVYKHPYYMFLYEHHYLFVYEQ